MDEWQFEQAVRIEQAARDEAIDVARRRQADKFPLWDEETCFKCGDDLPRVRIDGGRVFCIFCQEKREREGKRD